MQTQLSSRLNAVFFVSGKLLRFVFILAFLFGLFSHTQTVAGYGLEQMLLFFLTFNLVDIIAQFLFRGIYVIKGQIQSGNLDLILTQPVNVLFRIASSMVDFWDLVTLIPVVLAIVWVTNLLAVVPGSLVLYVIFVLLGVLLALAIHIIVAAIAMATQEVDSTIWIYRDLLNMARFPVDIYNKPVQLILTFIIPIALMVSFPAKILLGGLSVGWMMFDWFFTLTFLGLALWLWNRSLRAYSSASS
ncbi:ABC-2 family transporter protein [Candidatus Daviesbacteria bacterium]|nr:ABC-2 family transporter protein [Candidatus Daviesbacteria bacterium]